MVIHKGYKVLSPGRWSALEVGKGGAVQYSLGKWTTSKHGCGPLGVFIDEGAARDWALEWDWNTGPLTVHKCEFRGSRFRSFWRTVGSVVHKNVEVTCIPPTVRFADTVRTLD